MAQKKSKRNIVLLTTDSRESKSKVENYRAAAEAMGLGVRHYPDRNTIGVIPCSDSRAVDAAWLAQFHKIKGPDPLAVETATNKSLAYQFLRRQGFDLLAWHIPQDEGDLTDVFDKPVIIKPEKGSGSFGLHPWAYRKYASPAHFKRWLKREGLLKGFFESQSNPLPYSGRYVMMEYVDSPTLYTVAAVMSDKAVVPYDFSEMSLMSGRMQLDWAMIGRRHPDAGNVVKMIEAFAQSGFRHAVIYFQCIARNGKLFPIDINLRPGTMSDCFVRATKLPLYERLLGFMLGLRRDFDYEWPSPYIGIKRVDGPLRKGRYKADFGADAISLIDEMFFDKDRPYDLGHAWPMFAVLAKSPAECYRKAKRVVVGCTLHKVS